jgi:hypothetical protein
VVDLLRLDTTPPSLIGEQPRRLTGGEREKARPTAKIYEKIRDKKRDFMV